MTGRLQHNYYCQRVSSEVGTTDKELTKRGANEHCVSFTIEASLQNDVSVELGAGAFLATHQQFVMRALQHGVVLIHFGSGPFAVGANSLPRRAAFDFRNKLKQSLTMKWSGKRCAC